MTSPGSQNTRVTRSSPCCDPTVTTTSLGEASVMPSSAITSQIRSRSRGSPCPEPYWRVCAPMPETSSPIIDPTASSGSAVTAGMPPAGETTSGRLTTENSARISEVFIPWVRAAYRSASGSSRGCRGVTCECGYAPGPGRGGPSEEADTFRSVGRGPQRIRQDTAADGTVPATGAAFVTLSAVLRREEEGAGGRVGLRREVEPLDGGQHR